MKIKELLRQKAKVQVHIGGTEPVPGFILLSDKKSASVDIVHEYEEYPYPLPDSSVDLLVIPDLIEHINPANKGFIKFMDEMWRILKPRGEFMIATPYAGSLGYWQDPTHCNPCTDATFNYFDPLRSNGVLYKIYKPKPYKVKNISWSRIGNMEVLLEKRQNDKSYKS